MTDFFAFHMERVPQKSDVLKFIPNAKKSYTS